MKFRPGVVPRRPPDSLGPRGGNIHKSQNPWNHAGGRARFEHKTGLGGSQSNPAAASRRGNENLT